MLSCKTLVQENIDRQGNDNKESTSGKYFSKIWRNVFSSFLCSLGGQGSKEGVAGLIVIGISIVPPKKDILEVKDHFAKKL